MAQAVKDLPAADGFVLSAEGRKYVPLALGARLDADIGPIDEAVVVKESALLQALADARASALVTERSTFLSDCASSFAEHLVGCLKTGACNAPNEVALMACESTDASAAVACLIDVAAFSQELDTRSAQEGPLLASALQPTVA